MDKATRDGLVQRYKEGYARVAEALTGAGDADLDRRPAPGKWTSREIVHHLADSEMTSAIRLRRLLAEDGASIVGYDQEEFARRLHYDRPIAASLAAFRAARESTAEILDGMSEAEWSREGTHSESGRYTVLDWLRIYAEHAHQHADQIRRARAAA
jgi:isopentenyldiphosphate isomerase